MFFQIIVQKLQENDSCTRISRGLINLTLDIVTIGKLYACNVTLYDIST